MLKNDYVLDLNEDDIYNFLYAGLYHNEAIMSESLRDQETTDYLLKLFVLNSDFKTLENVMNKLNIAEAEIIEYVENK